MFTKHETYPAALLELVSVANDAVRAVPPLFPLTSSVAVNPFLGQTGEPLAVTAARMERVAGQRVLPERAHWAAKWQAGVITAGDLSDALAAVATRFDPPSMAELEAALSQPARQPQALPTVAELASDASGIDWPALIEDRIGAWAGSHFDEGQALWQPYRASGAFVAWREFAARDLAPEIHGLHGFGAFVAESPRNPWRALGRAAEALGLTIAAAPTAFHRLLVDLGGWAQYARYQLWQAELDQGTDATAVELLAIRMMFDEALMALYSKQIRDSWAEVVAAHAQPVTPRKDQVIDAIWQEASERAEQRALAARLSGAQAAAAQSRPDVQAAFCIDVRSEVFRRALEAQNAGIETIGFAGFFGLATAHRAAGSDVVETRGPVLLQPGVTTQATEPEEADLTRRCSARATRAWGRFKLAAVSSFAFVEATGPVYAGKLLRDALGLSGPGAKADPAPQIDPSLDLATRVGMAKTVLGAMSLTSGFGRIVMLAGHGASVTNNAHESTLNCGACGGHAGDVNARALAGLLNDPEVRFGLSARGVDIPADTLFLAALHDTTTDAVTLYEDDQDTVPWREDLDRLKRALALAGAQARAERAQRLPRAGSEAAIAKRATDWAELRPEWGLAGCRAFVAAPRGRTAGAALEGQAFLHSYDWQADAGFGVLELIMTAPVVVASWISLQYYGSTVAPKMFGGGNKLLHNVTGGIGVLEGNGGAPRAGLPWQSVHDGTGLQHDPLRLTVVIEAPTEAMSAVLDTHPQVRALFDNRWLHLIAMDDEGRLAARYDGKGGWEAMCTDTAPQVLAAE